jgi:antitoxin MazE
MSARIAKWGNSLGVRIPAAVAAEIGLKPGTEVNIVAEERGLWIVPAGTPKRYPLEELLKGITRDNVEPEVPAGPDVGREAID